MDKQGRMQKLITVGTIVMAAAVCAVAVPGAWAKAPQNTEAKPSAQRPESESKAAKRDNRTAKWFKKGELTSIGALGLVPWANRVGVRLDMVRSGDSYFAAITPIVNHTLTVGDRDLVMSFGAPLRISVLDRVARFDTAGEFHTKDWDSPEDYVKLIRHVTYGRKEDKFFLSLDQFGTSTIGHGTIVKRFNPNIALDTTGVSLEMDGYTDFFGVQTFMNHIAPPSILGGLAFVKPLSFFNRDSYHTRSFSVGFTMVVDLEAPLMNRLDRYDVDKDGRRGELLLDANGKVQTDSRPLFAYGIDVEMKLYKSADKTVDLKAYLDYSMLTGEVPKPCNTWKDSDQRKRCDALFQNDPVSISQQPGAIETDSVTSAGVSVGLLARFTLGKKRNHALRLRGEFRSYDGNYVPNYFDTLYQVQRVHYSVATDPGAINPANPTKMRRILERDPSRVYGFHAELTYQYWGVFEAGFGLSMNTRTDDNALFVHLGVPKNESFSFFISYMKTASASDALFDPRRNTVVIAQARVFLTPFLHLYAGALTPFGFTAENGYLEQFFDITAGLELSFKY